MTRRIARLTEFDQVAPVCWWTETTDPGRAGDGKRGGYEGLYQATGTHTIAGTHTKRSADARGIVHLPEAGSTADCSGPETSRVPLLRRKWFWATPWANVFSQLTPDLEGMVKVKTGIDTRSENLAHQAAATARIRPTTRNCIRRNPTCDWSVSTSESRIQCQSKKFDALASSDGRFAPLVRRKFLLNIKRSGSKLVLGGAGLRQRRARSNSTTARP
jgi:hypothetical protein